MSDAPPADEADDTITTLDLLLGVDLVTEEVEPGVFRIVSDGPDGSNGRSLGSSDPASP